jgi:pyridoxamine 5'-phosphate oxidase
MDPIAQFNQWLKEASQHPGIKEPTAMTLATVGEGGKPSARIVLLKTCDAQGFLFYTNLNSRKSQELKADPYAALCFYWMPLDRQVRIEGRVLPASDTEADAYFAGRPRARQVGAWASQQSQQLASREALDERVAAVEKEYAGRDIPRPPHWSGWRLEPNSIEFWQQSDARLHVRDLYNRSLSGGWKHSLLYP